MMRMSQGIYFTFLTVSEYQSQRFIRRLGFIVMTVTATAFAKP